MRAMLDLPPPPRRRFQFRLRTLLIAVAVLAVPMAWVGYSLNWIRQRHAILDRQPPRVWSSSWGLLPTTANAPGGLWLFGERGEPVLFWEPGSREDVTQMEQLFPEAHVVVVKEPGKKNGVFRTVR